MILVILDGQPNFARSDHKPVRFMLSNALVRSMNHVELLMLNPALFLDQSCTENHVGSTAICSKPALRLRKDRLYDGLIQQDFSKDFTCNGQ